MTRSRRLLRQTLTIARRDFVATVFTPIFLIFLLAPVLMGSLSAIGGMGAASATRSAEGKTRIVAIVPADAERAIAATDTRLRAAFRNRDEAPAPLTMLAPATDPARQARAAFDAKDYDAVAVLYGPLDRPHVLQSPVAGRSADYLGLLAAEALADRALGGHRPTVTLTKTVVQRDHGSSGGRHQAAFFAVLGVFFVTIVLASQMVGTMAEERNNKVIEVLAAAVPLEAVFVGKLIGMLGVACLFVGFWATVIGQVSTLLPPGPHAALADFAPAIGGTAFTIIYLLYLVMAFLLLGAVFLAVGAQATTMREIQLMSLPLTIIQFAVFGLASAAASAPGTWLATGAELFPLSSPSAMAAHAANLRGLWPHLAALAWQAMWVSLFVVVGARLFRRGVLQSGSGKAKRRRGKAN